MLLKKVVVYYKSENDEPYSCHYTAKGKDYLSVDNTDDGQLLVRLHKEKKSSPRLTMAVYNKGAWLYWQAIKIEGEFEYKLE